LEALLKDITGIEGNRVRLILIASITGFNEEHSWKVEDDKIVLVSKI